jgi:hypothetical protein
VCRTAPLPRSISAEGMVVCTSRPRHELGNGGSSGSITGNVTVAATAQTRPKLRQRSLQPSAPQGSKSQFRWRNAPKEHTQYHMQKARASGGRARPTNPSTLSAELPWPERFERDHGASSLCQIACKKFCEIIRKVSGRPAGWGKGRVGDRPLSF